MRNPVSETQDAPQISADDVHEIEQANASGLTPVVFIHGLWLLPTCWDRWAEAFRDAGYSTVRPGWPDDPDTVAEANAHPEVFARKSIGDIADHFAAVIGKLDRKPVLIGHSFGGLLTQILAGRGLAAASVAIDPAPFRGVLPLPISALRAAIAGARQPAQPPPRRAADLRPVPLRVRQRRRRGRGEGAVRDVRRARAPASRCSRPPRPTSTRGPRPRSTRDNPERGPLLIISGELDHTVPWAIANASYKQQKDNPGVTEIVELRAAATRW